MELIFFNYYSSLLVFSKGEANLGFLLYPPFAFNRGIYIISKSLTNAALKPLTANAVYDSEMANVYWFLVLDIFLYAFFGWYLDQVLPKEFGSRRPPYFIITDPIKWVVSKFKKNENPEQVEREDLVSVNMGENLEEIDENEDEDVRRERESIYQKNIPSTVGVLICNLRKVYAGEDGNSEKIAVHRLCLSIHKGECFGLLGPNGAGKTTTISILTGMYLPTSGYAKIGGFDVVSQMNLVRKNLGVCPQVLILLKKKKKTFEKNPNTNFYSFSLSMIFFGMI